MHSAFRTPHSALVALSGLDLLPSVSTVLQKYKRWSIQCTPRSALRIPHWSRSPASICSLPFRQSSKTTSAGRFKNDPRNLDNSVFVGHYPLRPNVFTSNNIVSYVAMKRYITGFVLGVIIFALSNVASHFATSSPAGRTDRVLVYGFPFTVWVEGGLPRIDGEFRMLHLCADVSIAVLCGLGVGVLFVRRSRHVVC
jgi:hypothetical protein